MKYIKTKLFFAPVLFLLVSCQIEDYNKNEKAVFETSANSLFNTAQKAMVDQTITQNVNNNNYRLYTELWTTTTYTDEPNYNVVTRNISRQIYTEFYRDVLKDLDEAAKIIDKELETAVATDIPKLTNQKAIVEIHMVFTYSQLVETFGNIPYTEAINDENLTPKYDDARTIYDNLLVRLKAAIESLDTKANGFEVDNIYHSVEAWKKLAASLYLRMGMVLADVDSGASKTVVEAAVGYGVLTSNSDNAMFDYQSVTPNRNPIYETITASGRSDYVIASTLVEKLDELSDPRRSKFYTEASAGGYKGGIPGKSNSYVNLSHTKTGLVPNNPGIVFQYSEVAFLLAEAAQRGYNVGGTAEEYYNKGIKASLDFWKVDNDSSIAYMESAKLKYDASKYKEIIGTQMWIATYNTGYPTWLSWRRLDYPVLKGGDDPLTDTKQPPYRMTYPIEEQTLNGASYKQAGIAIGGDKLEQKLFWDVN